MWLKSFKYFKGPGASAMYETALIKTISVPGLTNRTKPKKRATLFLGSEY